MLCVLYTNNKSLVCPTSPTSPCLPTKIGTVSKLMLTKSCNLWMLENITEACPQLFFQFARKIVKLWIKFVALIISLVEQLALSKFNSIHGYIHIIHVDFLSYSEEP